MGLRRVRFTVRMLMVVVAIVALSLFLYETRRRNDETLRRHYGVPLDRNSGHFLVVVKTFRGPLARSQAGALAYQFRYQHGLPSYVMASSEISRVKPSAKRRKAGHGPTTEQVAAPMKPSAKRRNASDGAVQEEVAVLIGDCQTLDESQAILDQVRRIQTDQVTSLLDRLRLRPFRTSNPYFPASVATK